MRAPILALLCFLFLSTTIASTSFPLTIAFRALLTKSEVDDVRLGLCEATTRLAGVNTSDTSCQLAYLSGTVYNFTAVGSDGLSGLNLTQLMTDMTLALVLRQANDGIPIRESDCNVLPPPLPVVNAPEQFWEAQKALLVICGLVVCCCLVMCISCGIADWARGRKADVQMGKHEASDLELPPLHAKRKSGSSGSSGATLIGHATSSRSQRPPVESTTSSPRDSFEDGAPRLLTTRARGSDTMPAAAQPRNNSLSSLEARDSDDGDASQHGNPASHPSERFTPMISLPEERPVREKLKERHHGKHKGYSTQVPESESDEEPPPPPPDSTASPPATSSSSSASSRRPFTVTVVPPSPHEIKSFHQKATTPQSMYKFEPLLSPSSSPSVRRPTAGSSASTASSSSSSSSSSTVQPSATLPPQSFRRPVSPVRKEPAAETSRTLPSRPPEPIAISSPTESPSPEPSPRYSSRSGRPRTLSRYSVEGSKAPAHPPPFSQGTAELKFAAPVRTRKAFTTDDEDRSADGEVPSLSGGSAKFQSTYKGNPLWDSHTASSDTRDRNF